MFKHAFLALSLGAVATLLTACGGAADRSNEPAQSKDELRGKGTVGTPPAADPTLPSVCQHSTDAACLADRGCAWGDQGSGAECFYVGEVVPQPAPSPSPGPGQPSVCSANVTEASCMDDEGCAWGDQGSGPECFYVGEITPFGK